MFLYYLWNILTCLIQRYSFLDCSAYIINFFLKSCFVFNSIYQTITGILKLYNLTPQSISLNCYSKKGAFEYLLERLSKSNTTGPQLNYFPVIGEKTLKSRNKCLYNSCTYKKKMMICVSSNSERIVHDPTSIVQTIFFACSGRLSTEKTTSSAPATR